MGLYVFSLAFCMSAAAWCIFSWAVKDGQFKEDDEMRNLALNSEEKYS